jgi:hypothetical protein
MISPIARLQVKLGILPVYNKAADTTPPLDEWPPGWDFVPVTEHASIDKSVTGIKWEPREKYEYDLDQQPEAVKRRLED